jgi:hypothetical protein
VPAAYAANYLDAVVAYVNRLHAQGLYAEVSLMWAARGTQKAQGHPAILDQDHAAAALRAIATAFKGDPNTFIGLQSEPHGIGWACWRDGGAAGWRSRMSAAPTAGGQRWGSGSTTGEGTAGTAWLAAGRPSATAGCTGRGRRIRADSPHVAGRCWSG